MGQKGDDGHGLAIAFASSFFSGKIVDMSWDGHSRKVLDVSTTESPDNYMEFLPADLTDAGELTVSILHDTDDEVPFDDPESITITYPTPPGGSSGATDVCEGFAIDQGLKVVNGDKTTSTVKIKFTGKPVKTPSS